MIELQGKEVGVIGKLHPNTVKGDVYALELDLDKVLANRSSKMVYKEISKFPSSTKDLAFIVDKNVTCEEVEKVIKKAGGKILKKCELFDLYVGENVDENSKSLAFKLVFSDPTHTLSEEEIMDAFHKIIVDVESNIKAKLRNK